MGQASVNEGARRRRGSPGLPFIWLPALAAVLVAIAFPVAAGAAPAAAAAPPPVNTSPPTIVIPPNAPPNEISTPSVGRYLKSTDGTWTGQSYLKRQWEDCNPTTLVCTAIPARLLDVPDRAVGRRVDAGLPRYRVRVWEQHARELVADRCSHRRNADQPPAGAEGHRRHAGWTDADHYPGTWDGTQPITYSYQRRRCDGAGLNCGAAFPARRPPRRRTSSRTPTSATRWRPTLRPRTRRAAPLRIRRGRRPSSPRAIPRSAVGGARKRVRR